MALYAPSPAIPLGSEDWTRVVQLASRDAAALAAKAARNGGRLGVGDASRYETLTATLRALHRLTTAEAKVAATALAPLLTQLSRDLQLLTAALPAHAARSVSDLASFLASAGQAKVVNVGALEATTRRIQMAITKDWTRLAASTQQGIVDAVTTAMAGGLGPRDAARAMARGVTNVGGLTMARANTIARTEMADLYDASRLGWMQDNAASVDGWWWRAREDACPICQILHGETFDTDDPPDRHHNCRCVMVPIPTGRGLPASAAARDRDSIVARLPKSWRDDAPADLRTLVVKHQNPGWRPSLALQR